MLVLSDGAPRLIGAISKIFPKSDRQHCIAEFNAGYYAADRTTADALAEGIIRKFASLFPGAAQCCTNGLNAGLTHLRYPEGHRRYLRTTNPLERTFEEQRRRTKDLPQHQHERGALGLVFGVLQRASQRWLRIRMNLLELV